MAATRKASGPYAQFRAVLAKVHPQNWQRSASTPHMDGVGSNVCVACALASSRLGHLKVGAHTFVEMCLATRPAMAGA